MLTAVRVTFILSSVTEIPEGFQRRENNVVGERGKRNREGCLVSELT